MIKDFLFGKKKYFKTAKLGTFEARIKGNIDRKIIWSSSIKLEIHSNEISIILDGNSNGPFENQVNEVTKIIGNKAILKNELLKLVKQSTKSTKEFKDLKLNDFQLSGITPWEELENSFELNYDLKLDAIKEISAIYENNKITKFS